MPKFLNRRLLVFKDFNWTRHFKENTSVVIVSVLFGVATHIVWDNFTHEHGQFVQRIDGLQNVFTIAGQSIPTYKLLQHTSTVIGGSIIIYALLLLPVDKGYKGENSIFRFWFLVSVITLATVTVRLLTGLDYMQYGNVIVTIITGGLLGLVLTPKLIALKM
jgi:hypothetical protein